MLNNLTVNKVMEMEIDLNSIWSPVFDYMEDFVFIIDNNFNIVRIYSTRLQYSER